VPDASGQLRIAAPRLKRKQWPGQLDIAMDELYTILVNLNDRTTGPIQLDPDGTGNAVVDVDPVEDLNLGVYDYSFPELDVLLDSTQNTSTSNDLVDRSVTRTRRHRAIVPGQVTAVGANDITLTLYPYGNGTFTDTITGQTATFIDDTQTASVNDWLPIMRVIEVAYTTTETANSQGVPFNTGNTQIQATTVENFVMPGSGGGGGGTITLVGTFVSNSSVTLGALVITQQTYNVTLYPSGLSSSGTASTAIQLHIDSNARLPANYLTQSFEVNGVNYLDVPIWV
jgi:hypothetical protein